MANLIAQSIPDIEISVIDYENGAMARNMISLPNLKLIVFNDNAEVSPPAGSILIMQSFVPYYWPKELKMIGDQKIFFWNLHPQNLIPSLLPVPFLRKLPINNFGVYKFVSIFYNKLFQNLTKYLKLLLETDSICFMDKTNLDFTAKYLFSNIEKKEYLPVPASPTEINNLKIFSKEEIHIGWVGRLCDFKSYILVYTINKLSEISSQFNNTQFVYHIVGDGPFLNYIKENIKVCDKVSVVFHGSLPHDKLDYFINDKFDIVTAMGTSALEGAKLGKPTILLDFTFKKIKKDYVFREIYNTVGFDLAHLITNKDYKKGNDSLLNILNNIILNYPESSQKAKEYFTDNHNIESVKNLFVEKTMQTKLVFSMIDSSIMEKGRLLKIYNRIRKLTA
ncbi:hypothetical protein [Flavobacterium sp. JAS]|uniref:hypothetical protein n=1 Tax=Flavobacterium sp. JAS TaxID=2897329 RepID=UPI001E5A0D7C|nr:hypothetical protein [Flavobacterium sp. JAS]MCD0471058.1 hypothetical protein [Flavobacterium sp. JAS]